MVVRFKKFSQAPLSANFSLPEFHCRCKNHHCEFTYLDTDLVLALEELRSILGAPIRILSGYRCSSWNDTVGGKSGSIHLQGKAVDIAVPGHKPSYVLLNAENVQAFKNGGGCSYGSWTHLDVRGYRARWKSPRIYVNDDPVSIS